MKYKNKVISGIIWSAVEKIGQQVFQIVIAIILARLLQPSDYGMIGLMSTFIIVSRVFVDSGFNEALIRKQNCKSIDYTSIFWFNLLLSIVIYVFLFCIAPYISVFFSMPYEFIKLSRVLFLAIPINAFNLVQTTVLNKKLDFKKIAKYTIFSSLLSGICGISLAYCGGGAWALIVQNLLFSILYTIFLWSKSTWFPSFNFSFNVIKEVWSFSRNMLMTGILNTAFNNAYTFIIARIYSSHQLGLYSQANRYGSIPAILFENVLSRVTYPVLSEYQSNNLALQKYFKDFFSFILYLLLPLMLFLIVSSEELVLCVLSEKWIMLVPYFKIVCLMGITFPFQTLCVAAMKVKGNSSLILKLEIVKKTLIAISILLTYKNGIMFMLYGQLVFYILALLLNLFYVCRILKDSFVLFVKDAIYTSIPALIAFVFTVLLGSLISGNIFMLFLVKALIFFLIYLTVILSFYKKKVLYIKTLFK